MPAINFDRNGKLRYGRLLWRFVLLGAACPTPGVLRLLLVIVSEFRMEGNDDGEGLTETGAYFFRTSMRSVLGLGSGKAQMALWLFFRPCFSFVASSLNA